MESTPGTRKVLVAVDDSDASTRVAEFVNRFFGGLDVEIIAINVGPGALEALPFATAFSPFELGGVVGSPAVVGSEEAYASRLQDSEDIIDRSPLHEDERVVDAGDPVEVIERAAEELDVDLVVVGTEHKGLLDRLLSKSVAAALVRSSPRPVLVVH